MLCLARPRLASARVLSRQARRLSVPVLKHVDVPQYERDLNRYPNHIAHLGVGGFHRSHQAHYLHELLMRERAPAGGRWALVGFGLMPADKKLGDALEKQQYLYTVLSQGPDGSRATIVGVPSLPAPNTCPPQTPLAPTNPRPPQDR